MPYSSTAEIYFISAMFLLILVICSVACYFFFKTFQLEKKAKEEAQRQKELNKKTAQTKVVETSVTK